MIRLRPFWHCWLLLPAPLRRRWLGLIPLGALSALLDLLTGVLILRLGARLADPTTITWNAFAALAFVVVLKTALRLIESVTREHCTEATGSEFARRVLQFWLAAPLRRHLATAPAQRLDDISAVAHQVSREGIQSLVLFASEGFVVLALMGLLFSAAPLPAFAVLLACGLLAFATLHLSRQRHERWNTALTAARLRLQAFTQGCLQGVREIRLAGQSAFFAHRYTARRADYGAPFVAIEIWRQAPFAINEALFLIGALSLLLFAGLPASASSATTLLLLFLYSGLRLLPAVNRLVYRAMALRTALPSALRVQTLLAESPAPTPPVTPAAPAPSAPFTLSITAATFTYPERTTPALADISLTISAGERLALVGPSGSGKSTLLLLLSGLLAPDRGTVTAGPLPVSADDPAWQNRVGFVGQETFLLNDTLRHNLALGDDTPDPARLATALAQAQLADLLATLPQGLDTVIGENGCNLSGGQRQRVALARALYRRPALLLLDEATAFIDQAQEQQILAALTGATVIFVTHRLAAARTADRVAFLRAGHLEACAPFAELAATHPGFQSFLATESNHPSPETQS